MTFGRCHFNFLGVRSPELSRLRRDFSDRMNKIYMIFIYPVDPVKKKVLYYQVADILFVFSVFRAFVIILFFFVCCTI